MLLKIDREKHSFSLGMLKMHGWINDDLTLTELGKQKIEEIGRMFPQSKIIKDVECDELRIS
jgi:hypothetical protein